MINVNDVQHRMSSINQTRQITNAMYLLSATRVKRDSGWVELTRSYFRRVRSAMRDILEKSQGIEHRYMQERPTKRAAYIVMAGDKGLAGGYNHSVLSFAQQKIAEGGHSQTRIIAIGQMAKSHFEAHGYNVNSEFVLAGHRPYLRHARRIVDYICELFDGGEVDEIYAVYTRYDSPFAQFPQLIKLLPIMFFDYKNVSLEYEYTADILYEPSPQAVFDTLVPEFTIGLLFGGMVQSYISEHTARMNAMDSATRNADEMLAKLSLQYNTARQYAITREISEIVGAAQALEHREG